MIDYLACLEAAGWIEPCTFCKGTHKGTLDHYNNFVHKGSVTVDCWHCTDTDSIRKHIDGCTLCVEPYKRRGGGQSLIPPQVIDTYCPMCNHVTKKWLKMSGEHMVCARCGYNHDL